MNSNTMKPYDDSTSATDGEVIHSKGVDISVESEERGLARSRHNSNPRNRPFGLSSGPGFHVLMPTAMSREQQEWYRVKQGIEERDRVRVNQRRGGVITQRKDSKRTWSMNVQRLNA